MGYLGGTRMQAVCLLTLEIETRIAERSDTTQLEIDEGNDATMMCGKGIKGGCRGFCCGSEVQVFLA